MKLDWNHERYRTRDLLLEYNSNIMPFHPRAAGLAIIYPWENTSSTILLAQLYQIAAASGYEGTEDDFKQNFGHYLQNAGKELVFAPFVDFPEIGNENTLYFASDTKILYYYDEEYIPVNAMLITDTIINGGEA